MSGKQSLVQQRAVRMELLRARAAIERQGVVREINELRGSLTPRGLLEVVFPKSRRASPSDLLVRGLAFSRRYPMLLSLGSALLSRRSRKQVRWLKLAGAAVLAWQLGRGLRR